MRKNIIGRSVYSNTVINAEDKHKEKIMKKIFLTLFFLVFIKISLFAEVGAGYYFRFNDFKFFMDFNEFALEDYPEQDEEYINSSKCFYSIFQTLYYYKKELEKEKITFDLHQFEMVPIENDKIVIYIQKNGIWSAFDYYLNPEFSYEENIYLILNSFLPFSIKKQSAGKIELYRVNAYYKDYDNLDWIYKWKEGNLFFGILASYFYDYAKDEYVSYFFSREDAISFLKRYNLTNEYLKEIEITSENVYSVFGLLVN